MVGGHGRGVRGGQGWGGGGVGEGGAGRRRDVEVSDMMYAEPPPTRPPSLNELPQGYISRDAVIARAVFAGQRILPYLWKQSSC